MTSHYFLFLHGHRYIDFIDKLHSLLFQSVLQQATSLMSGDSKEKNDEGKKNLLLTTLQVRMNFILM